MSLIPDDEADDGAAGDGASDWTSDNYLMGLPYAGGAAPADPGSGGTPAGPDAAAASLPATIDQALAAPVGSLTRDHVLDQAGDLLGRALANGALPPDRFGDLVGRTVDFVSGLPEDDAGIRRSLAGLAAGGPAPLDPALEGAPLPPGEQAPGSAEADDPNDPNDQGGDDENDDGGEDGDGEDEGSAPPSASPSAPPAPAAAPPPRPRLGDLSMKYETGAHPGQEAAAAAKVSTGKQDAGGVSYGAYQLASSKAAGAQVLAFLHHEGARWAPQFAGKDPTVRGGDFQKTWEAIARRDPDAFFRAQHAFIARTHYAPVVAGVQKRTGLDLDARSDALRNVAWSMAVNHGRAQNLIVHGVHDLQGRIAPSDPGYDRALINHLYDLRGAYVRAHVKKGLPGLLNRYAVERRDALTMLGR